MIPPMRARFVREAKLAGWAISPRDRPQADCTQVFLTRRYRAVCWHPRDRAVSSVGGPQSFARPTKGKSAP